MAAIITLTGRVGKDPETSETGNGTTITRLSVATSARQKKDGEWADTTTWWRVTVFGQPARYAAEYISKGDLVEVSGEVSQDEYVGRDGEKRTSLEIKGHHISRLTPRTDSGQKTEQERPARREAATMTEPVRREYSPADDEPPF
jgi:single-strand DNA-binding protein